MSKIYLASSWRNPLQPSTVELLRMAGHEVYDFRNPPGGIKDGFRWSEIDPTWMKWTAAQYRSNLESPLAQRGFHSDFDGMKWADVGILLLPCGRSAHLELGWMAGAGKRTVIWTHDGQEPELMALLATRICVNLEEVLEFLQQEDAVPGTLADAKPFEMALEAAAEIERLREVVTIPLITPEAPLGFYMRVLAEHEKGEPVNAQDLINALMWRVGNQRKELARLQTRDDYVTGCLV